MKKHILGIIVFLFVFLSNIYFVLNLTVTKESPSFNLIKAGDNSKKCLPEFNHANFEGLTFEVLSVKYDGTKITREIRFHWNGKGKMPKSVLVNSTVLSAQNSKPIAFDSSEVNLVMFGNKIGEIILMNYFDKNKLDMKENYFSQVWIGSEKSKNISQHIDKNIITSPIIFAKE